MALRISSATRPHILSSSQTVSSVSTLINKGTILSAAQKANSLPARTSPSISRRVSIMGIEAFVKGAPGDPSTRGDCPFSHRVLLTLHEKKIPFEEKYVDLTNKPQWFLDINPEGKVPALRWDGKEVVTDSDVITQKLEERYPEPSLKTPESSASVGAKLFPAFVQFLTTPRGSPEEQGKLDAFLAELRAINQHLNTTGRPFLGGEKVSAADLALIPKLYHAKVALKHFKDFTFPWDLAHLDAYIKRMMSRDSFKASMYGEDKIIAGWAPKVPSS
eukprot:jgi/Mesvir1/24769/Mv22024-RA.1